MRRSRIMAYVGLAVVAYLLANVVPVVAATLVARF